MRKYLLALTLLGLSGTTLAMGVDDDPLLTMVMIDRLEVMEGENGNPLAASGYAWLGTDRHKLWLKGEGEYHDGTTEEAELQLLYSRAVTPFWDLQLGVRHDYRPLPEHDWLAIGVHGTAPYLIEVDAALFLDDEGHSAARLDLEYEYMLTQRWVLTPELEANLYGEEEPQLGRGSGLSDLTLGLRLGYEIRREITPYLGYSWSGLYGKSADYARAAGGETSRGSWLLGIRAWF